MSGLSSRPFNGPADLQLLRSFAADQVAVSPLLAHWHPGDITWQLHSLVNSGDINDIRLWFAGDDLAAAAIFEPPVVVIFDAPPELVSDNSWLRELTSWGRERRSATAAPLPRAYDQLGDAAIATPVPDADATRIAALKRVGFRPADRGRTRFACALDSPIEVPPIPAGMRIRAVGKDDLEERVDLHRDAWSVWGPSSATVERYRLLRSTAGYAPSLDLVLEDSNGRFLSYCICWEDARSRTALFEPVGTRPAHTRQGLGRLVILSALELLRARGVRRALVNAESVNAAALALYPRCGFETIATERFYVLDDVGA